MVDIHSHILPEVDDGAKSWEMAVHMCAMAARDGIEHMVATPHANDEFFYDRKYLRGVLAELQQRIEKVPRLSLGCDFHFSYENLQRLDDDPHQYTIEETPYLLVELSDYAIPPSVTLNLEELVNSGLKPIITHPERNPLLMRRPEQVLEWIQVGCPVQVTASSLTNLWGDAAKKVSHWLLKRHAVHILATDAHSIDGRPPILSVARGIVADMYGEERAEALVNGNPAAVVAGEPLVYFPPIEG